MVFRMRILRMVVSYPTRLECIYIWYCMKPMVGWLCSRLLPRHVTNEGAGSILSPAQWYPCHDPIEKWNTMAHSNTHTIHVSTRWVSRSEAEATGIYMVECVSRGAFRATCEKVAKFHADRMQPFLPAHFHVLQSARTQFNSHPYGHHNEFGPKPTHPYLVELYIRHMRSCRVCGFSGRPCWCDAGRPDGGPAHKFGLQCGIGAVL